MPVCGNAIVESPEECDDGNTTSTDSCTNACRWNYCGDAFRYMVQTDGANRNALEPCDDGNTNNSDACVGCAVAYCGDGYVQSGVDDCDDGNSSNTDGCVRVDGQGVTVCRMAVCGDGFVQAGVEECDDGNAIGGDGCEPTCEPS